MTNMSLNVIRENKILNKNSEFTVFISSYAYDSLTNNITDIEYNMHLHI